MVHDDNELVGEHEGTLVGVVRRCTVYTHEAGEPNDELRHNKSGGARTASDYSEGGRAYGMLWGCGQAGATQSVRRFAD